MVAPVKSFVNTFLSKNNKNFPKFKNAGERETAALKSAEKEKTPAGAGCERGGKKSHMPE